MCSKIKRIITKVKKEGIVKPIERRIQNQKRQKEELKIIQNYHLIDDNERKRQREEVFEKNIKISIITPLYNTPENYLIQLIESVCSQTYANLEFVSSDGSVMDMMLWENCVGNMLKRYKNCLQKIG